MNIIIKGTNLDLSEAIKAYVHEKVGMLGRLTSKIMEARVELERATKHHTGDVFRVEVMLYLPREMVRAEVASPDLYASIDQVIPKLKVQLEKYHEKRKCMLRQTRRISRALKAIPTYFGYEFSLPSLEITKRKSLKLNSAMSEEEAINEMNRIKHSFFV